MRIAVLAVIAFAGAASAQTPAPVMADFDADGRLDSATLTVSGGKYKLEAELGGEPRRRVSVLEGAAAQAPTSIAVARAGNAEVLELGIPGAGSKAVYRFRDGKFARD